ncbi:MAG TPA: alpha/beta hydrolase family protein [Spirochaetia bacterium]|nr:alpha/beta hydrolase family protein [Spirochaetia bacterium]
MAFLQCDFFSATLALSTSMNVVLPLGEGVKRPYRTLYLLHGLSDDHTIWARRTSIERYADAHGVAVVMPAAGRSFYVDMANGARYGAFFEEELPSVTRSLFPLSPRREDTFVAGLSMGGYGAFRLALRRPDLFCAAGSFSGALNMAKVVEESDEERKAEWQRIFGDAGGVAGSDRDLFHLADALPPAARARLRLYQCCGTEDFLYQDNLLFRDHARRLGLDLSFSDGPGDHEWGYWDRQVKDFLDWLLKDS